MCTYLLCFFFWLLELKSPALLFLGSGPEAGAGAVACLWTRSVAGVVPSWLPVLLAFFCQRRGPAFCTPSDAGRPTLGGEVARQPLALAVRRLAGNVSVIQCALRTAQMHAELCCHVRMAGSISAPWSQS